MQRKIIALALASLISGAAFAQSSVTIYGIADAGYLYSKGNTHKFSGIQSAGWNGGRLGFTGEEGLGNGLKAIFTFEFGNDIDTSSGLVYTRQSFVGLDTSVGAFTLGRQLAPSGVYVGGNSSNLVTGNYASNNLIGGVMKQIGGTIDTGGQARWDNSVVFQSKAYSGVSVRAIYSFGEKANGDSPDGASTDGAKFGISANYANGPLNLDLIYQSRLKDAAGTGTGIEGVAASPIASAFNTGRTQEWYIGGGYDFQTAKVMASYQQTKTKDMFVTEPTADIWTLGGYVPVSVPGKIRVEYADSRIKYDNFSGNKSKSWGFSGGYTHEFSKRTMLYTSLSYMKNNAFQALGANGAGAKTAEPDHSNISWLTGIRHKF